MLDLKIWLAMLWQYEMWLYDLGSIAIDNYHLDLLAYWETF